MSSSAGSPGRSPRAPARPADPGAPVSAERFRQTLAQYATGIAVVTARAADGTPVGMTINSFASVSLEPPLVLWSLGRRAGSFEAFAAAPRFLVHVLAAGQLELARRFATRGAPKFADGDWHDTEHGLPLLDGAVAWLACETHARHDAGDHVIVVGQVTRCGGEGGAPLIFHDRRYVTHLSEAPLPAALRSEWS